MGSEKRRAKEKREKSQKKPQSTLAENKAPLPKYTNYHALNALQGHIYRVTDKNLFRKPKERRGNKSQRDVRKIVHITKT